MGTTPLPLVSVVIPAFNAETTIERSVQSVRAQTYPNIEIIIVNDGSKDCTAAIVKTFRDKRIRLLNLDYNQGAAAARNHGIAISKGAFIAFLDADDEWHPEKLGLQVDAIRRDEETILVTCNSVLVGLKGDILSHGHLKHPPLGGREGWKGLLRENFIPTPTAMVRRRDLEKVGGFNERLPVGEDLDLWIRLSLLGSVCVLQETLVTIHVLSDSLMRRYSRRELDHVMPMLERHICEQANRLSPGEIRSIRGKRFYDFAARLMWQGGYLEAAPLFFLAARSRHRMVLCLVKASYAFLWGIYKSGPSTHSNRTVS
jgi:glycosyltransferase involved in cell wall biosynthesis